MLPFIAIRGLRGGNIRSEKESQRKQFFALLMHIVELRNEQERKHGSLWHFRTTAGMQEVERSRMPEPSSHTFCRAINPPA